MNETIKASFGLDSTAFVQGLDKANQQAGKFKQRLESVLGPGLLRGAGVAAIGSTLALGILNASRRAAEMADELERSGKAVDDNLRAAGELARTWDNIKSSLSEITVKALGAMAGFGERVGRRLAVAMYGEEQVAEAEASERAAIQRERELARVKGETAAKEREKAGAAAKSLDTATQIERIEDQIRAIQFARSSLTAQQGTLERRLANLAREYAEAEGDTLRQTQIRLEAMKTMDQLMGVQLRLEKQITDEKDKQREIDDALRENARQRAENAQRILDLTAQASQIQADARQRMSQVGQPTSRAPRSINDVIGMGSGGIGSRAQATDGSISIPRFVGDLTRSQFRQAERIANEETRAMRAEMRGNTDRARQIRDANARRAERDFPGVKEGNDAERQSIAEQAREQVKQLENAVGELKAINQKLEQG
jgi:hypothetical protein